MSKALVAIQKNRKSSSGSRHGDAKPDVCFQKANQVLGGNGVEYGECGEQAGNADPVKYQ